MCVYWVRVCDGVCVCAPHPSEVRAEGRRVRKVGGDEGTHSGRRRAERNQRDLSRRSV